jgi:DNA-binding cell septation regulator SpoVG
MRIEIVGFYEIERNDEKKFLKGTMHIYLIELGIDIRGLTVLRDNNKILIYMPQKISPDEETKEKIRYPIFQFTDMAKNKELIQEIRKLGVPFIKEEVLKMEKKKFKKPRTEKPIDKSGIFSTRSK